MKKYILSHEVWSGFGEMICDALIPALEESKNFTFAEVAKFKSEFSR